MTPTNDEPAKKMSSEDFIFGKVIGEGSFSTVYLAKDVHSGKEFAIKVLEKTHIIREKKTEYVMREKEVLRVLGSSCRFFVHLYGTFQDTARLYFVLTYAKNGELLKHINQHGHFNFECTRYYTAELVLALEYLRSKGIVHRDLKPENILFNEHCHILITDFGSAKIEHSVAMSDKDDAQGLRSLQNNKRRASFVGTAQFVSPEMLKDTSSSFASDLWALGCIAYQMLSGQMPFTGNTDYLIFVKIQNLDYSFPKKFDERVQDFVEKLLVLEPNRRLGASDSKPYTSIREHRMFDGVDWDDLGPPPKLSDHSSYIIEENDYDIPENAEPGLDTEKISRLVLRDMFPTTTPSHQQPPTRKSSKPPRKVTDLSEEEIKKRLSAQESNPYNDFVEGNLILKQGLIDKRKGLFKVPRRRMFLLTLGPHLYYVDPVTMTLKGEIPWSEDLKAEAKNFKTFFVHTPNRKYYLEDPEGYALEWCKVIEQVKEHYFASQSTETN